MRRSIGRPVFASLFALALAISVTPRVAAQLPPMPDDARLVEPWLAWDRGDYPEAVRGYLAALEGSGSDALVQAVARLTGELYHTYEVAPDGAGLVMAPDGGYVAFAVTAGDATLVKVADTRTGSVVATLEGAQPALGAGGALAVARVRVTPEVLAAAEALVEARAGGDRAVTMQASRALALARARATDVVVRGAGSADEQVVGLEGAAFVGAAWTAPGELAVLATDEDGQTLLLRVLGGEVAARLALGPLAVRNMMAAGGDLFLTLAPAGLVRVGQGGVVARWDEARQPSLSADGGTVAYLVEAEGVQELRVAATDGGPPRTLVRSARPLANPALSPDGRHVAYQDRVLHDQEIFVVSTEGPGEPRQLTFEIQHDLFPAWVGNETVLAAKGEGRHRRAYLYGLDGGEPLRLFHNNTLRTIAPEYEWAVTPDGTRVVIVSERDGDTVSPERGVYLVDLERRVTRDQVVSRLQAMLAAEEELRERGRRAFAPLADQVRAVTERVDVTRIYAHARDLYRMGSKHITQPGNQAAIDYYVAALRAYGYEPELQWFEPRPGVRTANVIARLEGTRHPEVVYVVSSHFDSVERGPGADDDTSGGTALLEAARVLRDHPMPATIEFAFFTGEEAGLLGSREYVRRAVAEGKGIAGALNNDMIGWANDHRLDNTIRYSNPGIRDIQHAAAMQFSDLITYDALYYKNTDAHAYYEEYGDIVGGIGSYPVLGNPHYHQATDRLETINQQLVAEVSRTTVATLMLLASVPARLRELEVDAGTGETMLAWAPAPESDVVGHLVRWLTPDGEVGELYFEGTAPRVLLPVFEAGTRVGVKAVNGQDAEGWDWAVVTIGAGEPGADAP